MESLKNNLRSALGIFILIAMFPFVIGLTVLFWICECIDWILEV